MAMTELDIANGHLRNLLAISADLNNVELVKGDCEEAKRRIRKLLSIFEDLQTGDLVNWDQDRQICDAIDFVGDCP